MGLDARRPPLPAPTEPSTLSSIDNDTTLRDDLLTDVSTRTDKTSYSIPEDGTPVTINTAKKEAGRPKKHPSQTSLLIEYFEGGKGDGKVHSRPSVRVRVTPSHRKSKSTSDHLQITQTSRNTRKPSYTRRISLGGKHREDVVQTDPSYSEGSNVSSLPPVDIEVLQNISDLSSPGGRYIPVTSDISSMPPDSMLEGEPVIRSPARRRSRSLERTEEVVETETRDTLKAPTRQRSRSLSKERITQRVMEKLQQKPVESSGSKAKTSKTSREELTPSRKSHRRTSKGSRDEEISAISGTESSVLSSNAHRRSGDAHSIRSGASGASSINNPKLLATVEDAIKRLILPELNALKEEQRTQQNRSKFERMSRESAYESIPSTSSRDHSRRRVSKSSSAPHIAGNKPKVVLNRDGDDPGTILSGNSSRRERRSSKGSVSDRSYADSTREEEKEKVRRRKSKDKDRHFARDAALAGLAGAGLTAAALRHHDSRESKEDRKERKRRHSRSGRSRTASISESVEGDRRQDRMAVPPLPILQSELQGSELTRESILSAETETRDRPSSRSSRGTGSETPIHQVPRGYMSPSPRTPTRTPVALQRAFGTAHSNRSQGDLSMSAPKSDRSLSSRSREVSTAGLEAAAAAKARALESTEPQVSQYEIDEQTPNRGLSPIQSEASYREEVSGSPHHLRSIHSGASMSSAGRKAERKTSNMSIQSFEPSPDSKMAQARKRPQGITLERGREILGEPETPKDADEFFAKNHEQNEIYRRELESNSQDGSLVDYRHSTAYTNDSAEGQYLHSSEDKLSLAQDIRAVGSNPEYVHTPVAVESAVASLHEPSTISVRSSVSSPLKKNIKSPMNSIHEHHVSEEAEHDTQSKERWGAIRDQAQTLAENAQATNSPRQSLSQSIDEPPKMHATAFPMGNEPEMGFGIDDESEVDTNPSIIKGPHGGSEYHDQTDDLISRQEEREQTPSQSSRSRGKVAALGAGVGAAAIAAAAAARVRNDESPTHEGQYHANVEDDYGHDYAGEHQYEQQAYSQRDRTPSRSPALWKDEGYQSANAHGGITPEFRNRSKLFDDDGLGEYDDDTGLGADIFTSNRHGPHSSGNSHGMSSPLYDSATGKGIDRIQSKDVVALMDHLTVRDAQRNARDTEILVTLVRSAAEMRNSFEEMKQFIRTQDAMIVNTNDKRTDLAEQRILGGPRPQPLGSPRVPRSSTEDIDVETKRKNVFKRALKGLSLKGDSDIKKIELMLIQLLGEVEGLKQAHALTLAQNANRSNSLTSYENLRASGDPGYEPEGRAGTASSPNHSGYLSNPSSRRIQDLQSGYEVHQPHRISTVEEDPEEFADHDGQQYENTERMTTPTQEARRQNSLPQETPPQASRAFRESQSQDNTPKRKHKSNSSSIFGIPKISRWSKTTASTNPESMPRNSGGSGAQRPFSEASRSGSQINVAYYEDEQYELRDDDRLRSTTSLPQEGMGSIRSPSPLVPEGQHHAEEYVLDDPKYQAHRNSLNLQHPQPRPGPTGRHQNYLESQAQTFEPIGSPDYDQWGSNPSLARNRLSGGGTSQGPGNLSPISSDGGYSQHSAAEQAAAPPRPPKVRDDGPLIPQQPLAGHGQTRQMYSSPNEFGSQGALTPLAPIQEVRYSLETDTGHHYSPTPSPRPTNNQNLNPAAAMVSPQRKITGPRPMGSRSPSEQQKLSGHPGFDQTGTVIRRKPVGERTDIESLESYRSSLDSEIF
ncbi:uncharacterized protein BDR25DRAFT_301115 [Lindgomyces ingoldianus]|uniref:Uncharacterized protein n=1 Tax=Lindgomyces ingoldianus TaxID=673940 RepID=A0ACB6RA95_9PLEO|nr:uncharacterized protein BDR25DRAFT_301115 [Lindgomyces ingoldianus]KAF2475452.1 hypothetical protein BDR25DRAFT_301115 [Lindgomyces ingoldianus]